MYRSNLCPSLYPFIHLFLCSWTASFCQVWPSCFICVYPCFQLPNMRHLVAMAPYCRSMCRRERVCPYCPLFFLLATHPPHSPPSLSLSGLCAALFIWAAVRGATQTHWSDFDCAPASVVALKLSSDGGWQGNNAGVNTTYRTVISVSAQQGNIHTLLGWVVNRAEALSLNYNHTHTHTYTLSCTCSDIVDWGFDPCMKNHLSPNYKTQNQSVVWKDALIKDQRCARGTCNCVI